ncbi:MAG: hypothetical protein HY706_12110 [Candidatus Hydrogenedentes bacterium]|nr:hypothetical protein [Candidatus Hydrogenedentota bacterium]
MFHVEQPGYIRQLLLVEAAGVFWLAAELTILFLILVARRYTLSLPLPERLTLTQHEKRRAHIWCTAILAFTGLLVARYPLLGLWADPAGSLMQAGLPASRPQTTVIFQSHLLVWVVLITSWLALEILIVYNGWLVFRRIRDMLSENLPGVCACPRKLP